LKVAENSISVKGLPALGPKKLASNNPHKGIQPKDFAAIVVAIIVLPVHHLFSIASIRKKKKMKGTQNGFITGVQRPKNKY
jgi:hypothetical protein